jgi:DNA-binding NarL/FixJ family response regulator
VDALCRVSTSDTVIDSAIPDEVGMARSDRLSLNDGDVYAKVHESVREAVQAYCALARDLLQQTSLLVNAVDRLTAVDEEKDGAADALTRRERHVLQLLTEGSTNRTIARSLRISERTVKNHLQSIYGKLGVTDRTGAVVKGIKAGLVTL